MPACGPVREVAATPLSCRPIARSATDWSSPVESSWSISRGEGSLLTSLARRSSLSVCFPIAETVTTRPRPESRTFFTRSATARICSAVATELPPYFWTMIPKNDTFRRYCTRIASWPAGLCAGSRHPWPGDAASRRFDRDNPGRDLPPETGPTLQVADRAQAIVFQDLKPETCRRCSLRQQLASCY